MSDERFLTELRAEVLAAAERSAGQPSQRRRGLAPGLAAAAAIVAVIAAGVVVARPNTAAASVEVTREGADLVVRLTDLESHPDEIEDAAGEAGLDIDVDAAAVGPSLVGKFIGSTGSEVPELVEVVEGDPASGFTGFRIPADFDGSLNLTLGRHARDGEEWAVLSDAAAPGEVLECVDLRGATLGEVAALVAERDAQLRVLSLDNGTWLEPEDVARHADAIAVRITSPSEGAVWVDVSEHPERFELATSTTTIPEGC